MDNNNGTCTITNNGYVSGSCIVTATSDIEKDKSASCEITLRGIRIASDMEISVGEMVTLNAQLDLDRFGGKESYTWKIEGSDKSCIHLVGSGADYCTFYAMYQIEDLKIRLVVQFSDGLYGYSNWCNITARK